MPTPARQTAFRILLRVETESSFAADLLHSEAVRDLPASEIALSTELVLGTLRWQGTLDFLARQFLRAPWASLDPEVRVALRMGLYQLRFLSRMPARAAVHESVELVKQARKRSAAALVNAVLRNAKDADLTSLRPPGMSEWEWGSIEHSHPAWLLERWSRQYGSEEARKLAHANNQPAPATLRLNPRGRTLKELEQALPQEGIETQPGRLLKHCRTLIRGDVMQPELYRRGEVAIQEEASQIVPHLLDVQEGQRVLDLCAAPGNKTAQLAQWAGRSGWVVACDIHLHRLRQLVPAGDFANVRRVALDGRQPLPFAIPFDRILVDAPCSGTGTLRRNPEIKWRLSPSDIPALHEKQLQLLDSATEALAAGGRIVYSTCSLELEENQEVIDNFLNKHSNFRLLPLRADAERLEPWFHPSARRILEGEFLQTSPAREETDGFFAAILVKSG